MVVCVCVFVYTYIIWSNQFKATEEEQRARAVLPVVVVVLPPLTTCEAGICGKIGQTRNA